MSANSTQVRPKQFMSSLVSGGFNSTQFKINQAQDKSFGQPMHPPSEVIADPQGVGGGPLRVGRRFGRTPGDFSHRQAAFERSKSVFGRLHQKKMSRLQYQEKMRRGERQAKIALTRSYRAGDLPDIKINSADLVSCLRNLCYRDSHTAVSVARMLMSGMYIHLLLSNFLLHAVRTGNDATKGSPYTLYSELPSSRNISVTYYTCDLGFLGASFCNIIDILSGFPELFMFELCQTGSYHLFENYRILN